jgi:hypothetical protein
MSEVVSHAGGIKVELDVKRLGEDVAREVLGQLASLFPTDAAEFWGALAEQAYRERRRVAAMLDPACSRGDVCPYRAEAVAAAGPAPDDRSEERRAQVQEATSAGGDARA